MRRMLFVRPVLLLIILFTGAPMRGHADASRQRESIAHLITSQHYVTRIGDDGSVLLTNRWHSITLYPNARRLLFNNVTLFMNGPFSATEAGWTLTRNDMHHLLAPLLRRAPAQGGITNAVVLLDPGHGGEDSGTASADNLHEKQLVLDIAQRTRTRLDAVGVRTILTRDDDTFRPLKDRALQAAACGASAFISIHLNGSRSTTARGVETYVLPATGFPSTSNGTQGTTSHFGNRNDVRNNLLGYHVHRSLLTQTGAADRGLRRARYEVLKHAACPAVLVECGFLSHPGEAQRLATPDYRERLAEGLARGIVSYLASPR